MSQQRTDPMQRDQRPAKQEKPQRVRAQEEPQRARVQEELRQAPRPRQVGNEARSPRPTIPVWPATDVSPGGGSTRLLRTDTCVPRAEQDWRREGDYIDIYGMGSRRGWESRSLTSKSRTKK